MPSQHNARHTVLFISAVAVVCSLVLSAATSLLQERQAYFRALDQKINILKAFGVMPEDPEPGFVEQFFSENVEATVVSGAGNILPDASPQGIKFEEEMGEPQGAERHYPLYLLKKDGKITAYAIPLVGKGLWSTLYGYFSLEADLNKVRGITFYKHGETPGLGAEIEQPWFQEGFVGKRVRDEQGKLVSVKLVKGKAVEQASNPTELSHLVDGISGATLTSRGVTDLIAANLERYEPYFSAQREEQSHGG